MSVLSFLAVLHLAKACAAAVAPGTLLPIVVTESHLEPLAIHDNSAGAELRPTSAADAVATAARLIAAGHSLDLGLAQINWQAGHLQRRGLPIAAAFDACTSLHVGAAVLAECWARAAGPDPQARLRSAIGCYNTGSTQRGTAYVRLVLGNATEIVPALELGPADPAPAPASPARAQPGRGASPFIGQAHGASAIEFPQSKELP